MIERRICVMALLFNMVYFLASSHIWEVELKEAIAKMKVGNVHVILFLVRDCAWENWGVLPQDTVQETVREVAKRDFTKLQLAPLKAGQLLPLNQWAPPETAYKELVNVLISLCKTN